MVIQRRKGGLKRMGFKTYKQLREKILPDLDTW
jgi:hypothetical protein